LKSKAIELSRRYKALGIKVAPSTVPCDREVEDIRLSGSKSHLAQFHAIGSWRNC